MTLTSTPPVSLLEVLQSAKVLIHAGTSFVLIAYGGVVLCASGLPASMSHLCVAGSTHISIGMRQPGSDSSSESDYEEQLVKKVRPSQAWGR